MPISQAPSELDREEERLAEPCRVVLVDLQPELAGGRFAIKRIVGDTVAVRVLALTDGHDQVACALKFRHEDADKWQTQLLKSGGGDVWQGLFQVQQIGRYHYSAEAWVDRFGTWRRDLARRQQAGKVHPSELLVGAELIREAAAQATDNVADRLDEAATKLAGGLNPHWLVEMAMSEELRELMAQYAPRRHVSRYERDLEVVVDRPRARYSTWYELFPRSCSPTPGKHGTLRDVNNWLPYLREMGFDVLYLPPIHPIGRTHRKGRNNAVEVQPNDPGSPWAIGATEGGHKSIHPELGTLSDLRLLVEAAKEQGIEVALDLAYQCSPDHPYVTEHPEWFRHRPDGSIQYAENPPKEYQDIYPFDFECDAWRELWQELRSVVLFWVEQGIDIFRVDNPHTKPFAFWEWLIQCVKRKHPQVLFLSEAFTRPAVMYELARLGFTQSYTYFTWRNNKRELTEYLQEITRDDVREYFRPGLWPNTPDILPEFLQAGGRSAFMLRFVLAATMGASCGIYGPAFELCEHLPRNPGSEEYLDSEKYQIRQRDLNQPQSLRHFIARVNRFRCENLALQSDERLRFHAIDNEQMIAYSKQTADGSNIVLTVANLDPHQTQSGALQVDLAALGLAEGRPFAVTELFSGDRRVWQGRQQIELNPQHLPARIFRIQGGARREQDFEYFL